MSTSTTAVLLDAPTLAAAIGRNESLAVVDCRFDLMSPHTGFHAYLAEHIPGARYAHLDKDLARAPRSDEGRHPLPDPADFAAWLASSGITPEHRVVVYDDAGGAIAARLWWMLEWIGHRQTQILDGGLSAWRLAGGSLEGGVPRWPTGSYDLLALHSERVVTTAEIQSGQADGALLVDARAAARFRGEAEPIDPVAGHIPGAANLPFDELLDADGCFKEQSSLAAIFADRVSDTDDAELIAMCGSGVTACHLLAARCVAGRGHGRLYAGSWSEWIRDPARPVARVGESAH